MDIVEYANYIEQGLSHGDMAKIYGYTDEEMEELVKSLGIYVDEETEEQCEENHYRRWTDEEDQFLRENHTKMNNVELSVALGRSYSSVTARKRTLQLSAERRSWTSAEVAKLRNLTQAGMTDGEIAKILNRTRNSVAGKRIEEGINKEKKLKKDTKYIAYKNGEKEAEGTIDEIAKQTGYSRHTLYIQSTPSRRRKSGDEAIKLYELEKRC